MEEKNIIGEMQNAMENIAPVVQKKWTIKKILLYTFTLYFVFLLLKIIFKLIFKFLDIFRQYIHDLTEKEKILEVTLWTLFGFVIGMIVALVLYREILDGLIKLKDFWNTTVLPWLGL